MQVLLFQVKRYFVDKFLSKLFFEFDSITLAFFFTQFLAVVLKKKTKKENYTLDRNWLFVHAFNEITSLNITEIYQTFLLETNRKIYKI